MFNDEWLKTSSVMYGFDPRLKVVAMFLFSVLVAVAQALDCLAAGAVMALAIVFLSDLGLLETLKRLLPVNGMVCFLWVFLPFSQPGNAVYSLGPFTATREGIDLALLISIKANVLMLMFISFAASTSVITTGQALSRLGVPDKLVHLFFFTYRYIHVIFEEYQRLKTAMVVRGFVPRTSIHTYRTYAYLVGMLIVKSANRAERVYRAMLCRGFHGRLYSLRSFSISRQDGFIFAAMALWIFGMGLVEWIHPLF